MIRINLLAEQKGGKRGAAKASSPAVMAEGAPNLLPHIALIAVLLLVPIGFSAWLYLDNQKKEEEVQQKQKELERYKGVREKVQDLERRKDEYSEKVNQIKQLKELQSVPVKLMNALVEVLPEGAWYTKLSQKGDKIEMEGKARSIKTISTLSDQLVAVKDFSEVEMGDISQEMVGSDTIYSYKVKCKFYPGGLKPEEKAEGTGAKPGTKAPAAGKK
jgi:Tfp pilus assembly protein PilN